MKYITGFFRCQYPETESDTNGRKNARTSRKWGRTRTGGRMDEKAWKKSEKLKKILTNGRGRYMLLLVF